VDEARTAIERFRANRASFIADCTALEDARRSLEDAEEKDLNLRVRFQFLETLVNEWRGRLQIHKISEREAADQKWIHREGSSDA